jgi:hypothetical protein
MRRLPLLFPALLLFAACSSGTATNNTSAAAPVPAVNQAGPAAAPPLPVPPAAAWLPAPGRHPARVMTLAPPAEAVALRDRMAAAIMRNQAWYQAYAAQHAQGELPWHANLGISEADYRRFLALTRQIGVR